MKHDIQTQNSVCLSTIIINRRYTSRPGLITVFIVWVIPVKYSLVQFFNGISTFVDTKAILAEELL